MGATVLACRQIEKARVRPILQILESGHDRLNGLDGQLSLSGMARYTAEPKRRTSLDIWGYPVVSSTLTQPQAPPSSSTAPLLENRLLCNYKT
jgi:hypothetical protein